MDQDLRVKSLVNLRTWELMHGCYVFMKIIRHLSVFGFGAVILSYMAMLLAFWCVTLKRQIYEEMNCKLEAKNKTYKISFEFYYLLLVIWFDFIDNYS